MQILFSLLTLFTGLSIPLIPFSSGFIPKLGIAPLKLGHNRLTRLVQIILMWTFTTATWIYGNTPWSWLSVALAAWFTFMAINFFPQRVFIDLNQPSRAKTGLAEDARVLAADVQGEVVAYPLELIVPHHISNDVIGGVPILVAW